MPYTIVDDIANIDLSRHALIEASAGTGKTFTLENLVVRLLKERPDIQIENILVVTFTEKATSELKARIQEKLVEQIQMADDRETDGAFVQKISDTLDAFDRAAIATIHGFCHSILKDFTFENQGLFQNEVVDDGPIFESLLKEQMRKTWPQTYGEHLKELLKISAFSSQKDQFLARVINLARHVFRPMVEDEIRPDTSLKSVAQQREDILTIVEELKSLAGVPPALSRGFDRLHINARTKKLILDKMVLPLENYLAQSDDNPSSWMDLAALIQQFQAVKSSGCRGIQCLVPEKWLKAGNNIDACPNLAAIAGKLEAAAEIFCVLTHYLTIASVKTLQTDVAQFKQQNGFISYDDMLSQVVAALYSPHSLELLQALRAKYKVAFVDEFQDTDPIQWRIFRRLFLDQTEEAHHNLLFLIGDPKQAIYAFRGADVFTYLEARNEMQRLSAAGAAGLYSLATNWRSKPELVAKFNDLFARREWFGPFDQADSFAIGYQDAESPAENELPAVLSADLSQRPALNVVDLSEFQVPRQAKSVLSRFIAREIRYLINCGNMAIQAKSGFVRALDLSDICILVRSKNDALLLEPELVKRDIPYSFYQKPGLFLSEEALYLSLVGRAVMDPGSAPDAKKALLTPFFAFDASDLFGYENIPATHPVKQLLFAWHDLASRRKWGLLFQSLLEDSGLLFREANTRDWDRKYTNYRQIFEHLQALAYRKNLDFRGLLALLDRYRKQSLKAADDADIHQIETEAQKVQIMTMHVSKGLQFPVVFIAGGLTQPPDDDYCVYHEDLDNSKVRKRKIIDLAKTGSGEKHVIEKDNEDKRLYYVALTRAQFKLYLPYFSIEGNYGWKGPASRFIAGTIAAAFPQKGDHAAVGWMKPLADPKHILDATCGPVQTVFPVMAAKSDRPLLPFDTNYQSRKIALESFSSLHTRMSYGLAQQPQDMGFQMDREKDKEEDEPFADAALIPVRLTQPAEMPGGADIGSMFHDILEHIDFAAVTADPNHLLEKPTTRDIIVKTMDAYQVDQRLQPLVALIVANTLTAPIQAVENVLVLGRLKPEDRMHEVEFYYPCAFPAGAPTTIADCTIVVGRRCFIRGFVDLVFRHNGQFFIADWKSNRLADGYGQKALDACMQEAGYHLQYKLYTVAVLRWLKHSFGHGFDAARQFGGVFYFFIRGMGSTTGDGVYFVSPAQMGPLEHLEAEIASRIFAAGLPADGLSETVAL
jgi:exodeoxyribonuclease V beta subunit